MKPLITLVICLYIAMIARSQSIDLVTQIITYKKVDTLALQMKVISPTVSINQLKLPAIVFFFGGGWQEGNMKQFEPQATYFASRGAVAFLIDYRVKSRHGTSPFDALKDAKSAIRFIRKNAAHFNIDTARIIASGASAGGQLAAASALSEDYDDAQDDLSISCVPNALVLFNPVIDNGPGNITNRNVGKAYKNFSPLHNITSGAPPTIIFQGTEDIYTPVITIKYYQLVMENVGSRCDLYLYKDQKHGFFNLYNGEIYFQKTLQQIDEFLVSLEYLKPKG